MISNHFDVCIHINTLTKHILQMNPSIRHVYQNFPEPCNNCGSHNIIIVEKVRKSQDEICYMFIVCDACGTMGIKKNLPQPS
jgi:hypothetical protein